MSAAANRDVILVQYSKRSLRRPRSPCGARDRRALTSRARACSSLAGAELARVRGLDLLFGKIERRVGARRFVGVRARESLLFFEKQRCCESVHLFRDTSSSIRSHSSVPRILSDARAVSTSAFASRRSRWSFGSSTFLCSSAVRSCSPCDDHARSGSNTSRWSRSRAAFLFTFR